MHICPVFPFLFLIIHFSCFCFIQSNIHVKAYTPYCYSVGSSVISSDFKPSYISGSFFFNDFEDPEYPHDFKSLLFDWNFSQIQDTNLLHVLDQCKYTTPATSVPIVPQHSSPCRAVFLIDGLDARNSPQITRDLVSRGHYVVIKVTSEEAEALSTTVAAAAGEDASYSIFSAKISPESEQKAVAGEGTHASSVAATTVDASVVTDRSVRAAQLSKIRTEEQAFIEGVLGRKVPLFANNFHSDESWAKIEEVFDPSVPFFVLIEQQIKASSVWLQNQEAFDFVIRTRNMAHIHTVIRSLEYYMDSDQLACLFDLLHCDYTSPHEVFHNLCTVMRIEYYDRVNIDLFKYARGNFLAMDLLQYPASGSSHPVYDPNFIENNRVRVEKAFDLVRQGSALRKIMITLFSLTDDQVLNNHDLGAYLADEDTSPSWWQRQKYALVAGVFIILFLRQLFKAATMFLTQPRVNNSLHNILKGRKSLLDQFANLGKSI